MVFFGEIIWNFNLLLSLRLIHICSVVLWSGSTLGGSWFVLCAKKFSKEQGTTFSELELWVRKNFIFLINLEHITFVILFLSGLGQIFVGGYPLFEVFFLKWKFWIFVLILIPMEITDIWLTNFRLSKALKKGFLEPEKLKKAILDHDRFYFAMTFLLALVFPTMFYLAIFKPSIV